MNGHSIRTFLGANTPNGFVSFYQPFLDNKTAYIIKGGPGTGKSSLMKKIAAQAFRENDFVEYVYCSSDPDSLDGVYIESLSVAVCDGTAPHTLDPVYPGAEGGIINLGECWDEKALKSAKTDIKQLNMKIKCNFQRAYKYLSAAGNAYNDIKTISEKYIEKEKLEKYTKNFINGKIPKKREIEGKVHKRFLSSFSPKGYVTFKDTVYTMADYVYVLVDRFGTASSFLERISEAASERGYDLYCFYNPLCPEVISHILIPELNMAVVSSNKLLTFDPQNASRIHFKRFINDDIFLSKKKLQFAERIMHMCVDEALKSISHAKELHDDLEDIYISSMDYDKVNRMAAKLLTKIFIR